MYLAQDYKSAPAKEHAHHGFVRRVKTLVRCIQNVFEALPPHRDTVPSSEAISDATINIQAFVFNSFGAIDNLAWIWVNEKGLKKKNGSPIPDAYVGLRKANKLVRESFSPEFCGYLEKLDNWFENLDDFRHALAHRIPLYIPPFVISPENEPRYHGLEERKWAALVQQDFRQYENLDAEQATLGFFRPWMRHSFLENSTPIVFHVQLLADFNTIEELGEKFLIELKR